MICLVVGVFTLVILPCQIYFLLIQRIRMLLQKRTAANTKRTAALLGYRAMKSINQWGRGGHSTTQFSAKKRRPKLHTLHKFQVFSGSTIICWCDGKFQRRPIKYNAILKWLWKQFAKEGGEKNDAAKLPIHAPSTFSRKIRFCFTEEKLKKELEPLCT